ncbi:unnamed protein product [Meloidogyne enterolobii]|uniref:Uncharacterized protein n=2 Tax=Meloidogyne enterolobii TaxID=390850 RepID=A0ACB0XXM5_MELEN|nr:unnamed protein product [Meloidogyne enterolobii]
MIVAQLMDAAHSLNGQICILFLIFIIILLIAGCICCGFFLLTDARQKVFHRKQREEINNQRIKRETGRYINGFNHKNHSTTIV